MNNMSMLLNMIKSGGNPQAILTDLIQKQAANNPLMSNVLNAVNSGDYGAIETIGRNVCRERGIDADEMLKQIKNQFQ